MTFEAAIWRGHAVSVELRATPLIGFVPEQPSNAAAGMYKTVLVIVSTWRTCIRLPTGRKSDTTVAE